MAQNSYRLGGGAPVRVNGLSGPADGKGSRPPSANQWRASTGRKRLAFLTIGMRPRRHGASMSHLPWPRRGSDPTRVARCASPAAVDGDAIAKMTAERRHDGSPGKSPSTIVRLPRIMNRSAHYWSADGHHDRNLGHITKAEKRLKKSVFRTLSALPIVAPVADRGDGCYAPSMSELLFSYGTLRQREVQLATFGRELEGYVDAVIGYELHHLTITDPQVIATSGSDQASDSATNRPAGRARRRDRFHHHRGRIGRSRRL